MTADKNSRWQPCAIFRTIYPNISDGLRYFNQIWLIYMVLGPGHNHELSSYHWVSWEADTPLFRQTLFRQMLFRQSAVRTTSTSLARLAHVEIVEIGKKLEWVKVLDASKARHWSRHRGDWGERSLGRVSQWVWGAPPPEKLQRTSTQLYCPWFSGFGSASFQSVLPVSLFNCSQPATRRPDCMNCRNSVCRNRVCRNSVVYPEKRGRKRDGKTRGRERSTISEKRPRPPPPVIGWLVTGLC